MKVFANREIQNLFQAVLAVWAVALVLTQGIVWHTTHVFSFGLLLVFLLLGGCLWGVLFRYFQRQSALLEQAVQQIQSCLDGNPDARLGCDREGELYRLFHSVNALAAVLSAHADNEQREKHFLKNTIADISHQLKTPLAALNIYNGLLQDEAVSPSEVKEFADLSEQELDRIETLVQNLLKSPGWMPVRSYWRRKTKILLKWCRTSRGSITIVQSRNRKSSFCLAQRRLHFGATVTGCGKLWTIL
jgi:signal transduction histidine kinase